MNLGFLVTSRCNAACLHCSTSCGPTKSEALEKDKILSLMDAAAAVQDGKELKFCFSGGEVFLDFDLLLELVAHGRRLGGRVNCVTNGYWATSDDKALGMLAALRDVGLNILAVSTSRFHQRYVKRDRVARALTIGRELGLYTVLKCPLTASDRQSGELEAWARSVGADELELFRVMPTLREGASLPPGEFSETAGLPEGCCPGDVLTVREDGSAYTCCNPGGFQEFLKLGSVHEDSLGDIELKFRLGGRQEILRRQGPAHFAREAIVQGHGERLRPSYAGVCELCAHIGSDPVLSSVAARAAEDLEMSRVLALCAGITQGSQRSAGTARHGNKHKERQT